jgi:hypothetical protein
LTDFEQKLTWIFGSSRTGSTWLLRMLIYPWILKRDDLGFGEPPRYEGSSSYPAVLPINESHFPLHLSRVIRMVGLPTETEQAEIDKADDLPAMFNPARADQAGFFFNRQFEGAWRPAAREMALARFEAHAKRAEEELGMSNPAILIKEPNGSFASDLTLELLPESRMVFLIRDGRDVMDSQLALHLPGRRHAERKHVELNTDEDRLDYVTLLAQRWVNSMRVCAKAYARLPDDRRTTVRYESLRSDPVGTLGGLSSFLGLGRTEAEIAEAVAAEDFDAIPESQRGIEKGKRAATPGLWRESLGLAEQERIHEIAGPTLSELGYEV